MLLLRFAVSGAGEVLPRLFSFYGNILTDFNENMRKKFKNKKRVTVLHFAAKYDKMLFVKM